MLQRPSPGVTAGSAGPRGHGRSGPGVARREAMRGASGAAAMGAAAYTAPASQGLLYRAGALYNASGRGLPIVMTVANRAIGAPINGFGSGSTTTPTGTGASNGVLTPRTTNNLGNGGR